MPADFGDEIADRTFAWSSRRPGSDLLAADDEQWIHLRERQYRDTRSGLCRHADCSQAPRQCETRLRDIKLVWIWRHQCVGRLQAVGRVNKRGEPQMWCRVTSTTGLAATGWSAGRRRLRSVGKN